MISKRWDIEVGSPREFFREIKDSFVDLQIGISNGKDPTLTNMAFGRAAEFDGWVQSGIASYRIYRIPLLIAGIILTSISIWLLVDYGQQTASYLSSFSPAPPIDIVLVILGFALLVIGIGLIRNSFPIGQISIIARLSGEAYQSKASAAPDEIVSHERAGIYSQTRLELFMKISEKPPPQLLERAEKNASYLAERFSSVISKYKILRDDMLLSSKDSSTNRTPLVEDTKRPPLGPPPMKVSFPNSSSQPTMSEDSYKFRMKCNTKILRHVSVCPKCGTPQFS